MSEQLPVSDSDPDEDAKLAKQSKRMVNKLISMVNDYGTDRNRARSLVLFETRIAGQGVHPMSTIGFSDRPEVELVLFHRDQVSSLTKVIAIAEHTLKKAREEVIGGSDLKMFRESLEQIAKLQAQQMKHLVAMETLLATLTKQQADQEALMARLAADAAALTQRASEHQDKMDLAKKTAAIPTALELKQRLALKYNVPLEQVDAILSAKAVEAIQADSIDG